MEILVIGHEGQLARAFKKSFQTLGFNSTYLGRKETGGDFNVIRDVFSQKKFEIIVNAAAYTQVDMAESEKDEAYRGNVLLPQLLARISAEAGIPLIHFSTDYVYDGSGETPWRETDTPSPKNYYGLSKLQGEQEIQKYNPKHLIFRTCWLYDRTGNNFPNKILQLAQKQPQLKIVADQIGAPTYVQNIADAAAQIIARGIEDSTYGVYNICNSGAASWFDFTNQIVTEAVARGVLTKAPDVIPVNSSEFATKAQRPLNSRLNTEKLKENFGISLPSWKEGLRQYFS